MSYFSDILERCGFHKRAKERQEEEIAALNARMVENAEYICDLQEETAVTLPFQARIERE